MNETTSLAQQLVRIDTTSGRPKAQAQAIELVIEGLRELDVEVMADLVGPHPWGLVVSGTGGHRLLLACHVDTVPVSDRDAWSFDPWGGEVRGDHLLGRGSVDMKAGLAAAVTAFKRGVMAGRAVGLLLTSDEEVGAHGASAAAPAVSTSRIGAVIVPEATSGGIHLGHRGARWVGVHTRGRSAHGSTPERGVSAVHRLIDVVVRARNELPLRQDPFLGSESWNLGLIRGGSAPNVVPDAASAVVDHRTIGDGEDVHGWWREQPEVDLIEDLLSLPSVRTDALDPWVRSLSAQPHEEPVPYFTDASVLSTVLPGVPIVIWGPGAPEAMHARNESVALAEVNAAVVGLGRAVMSWSPGSPELPITGDRVRPLQP